MTVQNLPAGTTTIFGARNMGGDENYGVYPGKLTDEEIFALEPDYWPAYDDGFIDYDLYMNATVELTAGDYTASFTSSEAGDHFHDLIEGHVTDERILRAYAMVGSEDWWEYDQKITDPNLGVDDYDYGPNIKETILITVR
ncbi:MAG: hypothetical protein H9W81_07565 [Enterococcus sp.]|nr:hypothetical protein [Enterococcus sp.]